jgi:hypothetical protein
MPGRRDEQPCGKTSGHRCGYGQTKGIFVMKKSIPGISKILCIIMVSLALSGCFNIFHYITRLDNGTDRHTIKMSILKNDKMAELGDELELSEADLEDFDTLIKENDLGKYEKYGATITRINNENELGYLVKMDLNYDKATVDMILNENPPFVPRYTQEGMIIPVQGFGGGMDNEYAALFGLGSYRLMISKRCLATIKKAALTRYSGDNPVFNGPSRANLDVLDLGDHYLIEVPFYLLNEDYKFLKLYSK